MSGISVNPRSVGNAGTETELLDLESLPEPSAVTGAANDPTRDDSTKLLEKENANVPERAVSAPAQSLGDEPIPWIGVSIKWLALAFLVAQNSAASLLMRWSRSVPGEHDWDPQVGVIMQEVMKGITCVALLQSESGVGAAFADRNGFLLTSIPAVLYLIQNNLQYVSVGHLSAPVYAVLYQTKILSTALLSVMILGKELKVFQWIALGSLTFGVALVTLSQMDSSGDSQVPEGFFIGVVAALAAATTSGLAGVSFEKILKGAQASLWARNLQLALYSVVIGFGGLLMQGRLTEIMDKGLFHGFTLAAWLSIANNAFGGLLIATVIKYADNIMKNFSQGLSLVLTTVMSCILFECVANTFFAAGVAVVIYSAVLYGGVIGLPQDLKQMLQK